jgi:hypothetical protein
MLFACPVKSGAVCLEEAIKAGEHLCVQSKVQDRLPQPFVSGIVHLVQGKERSHGGAQRFHQDAVELEPIGALHQRRQVREIRLPMAQHGAPAFLLHRRREGAEPAFPLLAYAKVHTCDFDPVEATCTPGDSFPVCTLETFKGRSRWAP